METFRDVLEENGVSVYYSKGFCELSFYSPAGEDFSFSASSADNESFVRDVKEYARDFDVDEHVMLWADKRGQNGVPGTIRELLEDAEDIKHTLEELSAGLEEVLAEIEEENDLNKEEDIDYEP